MNMRRNDKLMSKVLVALVFPLSPHNGSMKKRLLKYFMISNLGLPAGMYEKERKIKLYKISECCYSFT